MIQIDDTIISTELFEMKFCCDLAKCKGECCIEGDSGAPLNEEELAELEKSLPIVWDDLSDKSKKIIKDLDFFGEKVRFFPKRDVISFDYIAESKDTLFKRISVLNKLVKKDKNIIAV